MSRNSTNQTTSRNSQKITIDLVELSRQLLFHWKLLLAAVILCGGVAFVCCKFLITPVYSSTSGLYVFSKSTSVTSLADLQIGSSLTKDYEIVITGRPILDRVIARLNLDEDYESLLKKIDVSNPTDSRILYITVKDPDPALAKEIADRTASIASTFISQKMDQDPPSVIQTGYTDGVPVFPKTLQTTVIAVLLGFLAAAAYVTVEYLMNDTIMTPEDVQEKLGLNVLATLPLEAEDERRIRRHRRKFRSRSTKERVS